MQVNVERGRELQEAARQTQEHLLERTVMQHTDQEEAVRVRESEELPPLPDQRKHARDGE